MSLRSLLFPPYTRRQMALVFVIAGFVALIFSVASPTSYRGDWLDPRWWARVVAGILIIGGAVAVVLPARRRDP